VSPFGGVRDALLALRGRGARIAVVTSKLGSSARRGLAHCDLAELVDVVIASDDVTRHKPEPEPALAALAALGVEPARALMVGDAPPDIACGRAAGTRTAAVAWGPFPRDWLERERPDHWLEEPAGLAALDELEL
jgi:pyrophosphatase PpaX